MAHYKVIDMGNVIEIYRYDGVVKKDDIIRLKEKQDEYDKYIDELWAMTGWTDIDKDFPKEWLKDAEEDINASCFWDRSLEYKKTVAHRRRETIRRFANMNFSENSCFVTLTYKENMQDVKQGNADFKDFIKRLKRLKYSEKVKDEKGKTRYVEKVPLKYLAVAEFQKRGAVHYHFLINLVGFNLSTLSHISDSERELAKIWGKGEQVTIKPVTTGTVDNVGAYMIKYLEKGFMDDRTRGNNMYLTSRNLKKPRIIKDEEALMIAESLSGFYAEYTNEYTGFFTGNVQYKEYNLTRLGIERNT